MAKWFYFYLIALLYWKSQGFQALAITDELEVGALRDLYRSLNSPLQLERWKLEGGDPCQETWIGVQCFESSIINLKLRGMGLTGNLGYLLSDLINLKHLDLSANNIEGQIPYSLPPNVTHLNLSGNKLSQSIPYSLEIMKHLRHLNLSHNSLSGSLGDVFSGLENLKEMDLSFNNFTGDLPFSFGSLTNLTGLYLQNNQFTGSVIFLANLSLFDLNIEDNHFSGVIPENFQNIANLRFAGNKFDRETYYPPWSFPSETTPKMVNMSSSPPVTNLSAFESHPASHIIAHNKQKSHAAGIVVTIFGITLITAFAAAACMVHKKRSRGILESNEDESNISLPIGTIQEHIDLNCYESLSGDEADEGRERKMSTEHIMDLHCHETLSGDDSGLAIDLISMDEALLESEIYRFRLEMEEIILLPMSIGEPRGEFIHWLLASNIESEIIHRAVSYIDRKYEGNVPTLMRLCEMFGQPKEDIIRMEMNVLKSLSHRVDYPTAKFFVSRLLRIAQDVQDYEQLQLCTSYLLDLSTLDCEIPTFKPSRVAASIVFLSRFYLKPEKHPWSADLVEESGYESSDIKGCVFVLHELQLGVRAASYCDHIKKKYDQLTCVSWSVREIPAAYFHV